jgi:hypothetical protein
MVKRCEASSRDCVTPCAARGGSDGMLVGLVMLVL